MEFRQFASASSSIGDALLALPQSWTAPVSPRLVRFTAMSRSGGTSYERVSIPLSRGSAALTWTKTEPLKTSRPPGRAGPKLGWPGPIKIMR
ncbi:uncharacterized protein BJX67DRAFT_179264 [Aspergillus lucknowensis]|uniref:Uncharacterized protein n=1 Tax=Aspergillus lucknowensis TaxID=176173 RepID=A0ABR4LLZ0_9EURO